MNRLPDTGCVNLAWTAEVCHAAEGGDFKVYFGFSLSRRLLHTLAGDLPNQKSILF